MTRINDVARRAQVSAATVSRVLNNVPTVDPALADRVRAAAAELGYLPNGVARNLRRQRTDVIQLIISDVENSFFTAVARGAEDAAQRAGFSVLLGNSDEDPGKEARYLAVAAEEKVAGVILSPNHRSSDVSQLARMGIPVAIIDRWLGPGFDTVRADSRTAALTATDHLFAAGWTRPACITGPETARTARDRLQGYLDAYRARRRRAASAALIRHADFREAEAEVAAASLLGSRRPPDSLFVANATMALGALAALAARRLRPGRDIGIVAIDDAPWARLLTPGLSVVAQPGYEIGATAAQLLLERVAGDRERPPHDIVLPTRLIVRASSSRPRTRTGTGGPAPVP